MSIPMCRGRNESRQRSACFCSVRSACLHVANSCGPRARLPSVLRRCIACAVRSAEGDASSTTRRERSSFTSDAALTSLADDAEAALLTLRHDVGVRDFCPEGVRDPVGVCVPDDVREPFEGVRAPPAAPEPEEDWVWELLALRMLLLGEAGTRGGCMRPGVGDSGVVGQRAAPWGESGAPRRRPPRRLREGEAAFMGVSAMGVSAWGFCVPAVASIDSAAEDGHRDESTREGESSGGFLSPRLTLRAGGITPSVGCSSITKTQATDLQQVSRKRAQGALRSRPGSRLPPATQPLPRSLVPRLFLVAEMRASPRRAP
mmetsp:Transcript_34061/g.83752  ORF Transcript_34061/g.83752 Transcript_34061/m.83752 type:complete len:317 (-) Transcript_34061:123-1073(-)